MNARKPLANTFDYPFKTLQKIRQDFVSEINHAEQKNKSSLCFYVNNLVPISFLGQYANIRLINIGGSHIRYKTTNARDIWKETKFQEDSLPFLQSSQDLIKILKDKIPSNTNLVVLILAQTLEPSSSHGIPDGILKQVNKEHNLSDLLKQPLGLYLEKQFGNNFPIMVINDTTYLFYRLKALTKENQKLPDAALVIGTGINLAFRNNQEQVVSLETANFDKFPLSPTGKIINRISQNPGQALFEKEIAGAYLYKHFNSLCPLNLVSSTKELSKVALNQKLPCSHIANQLLERSASLIATNITALSDYSEELELNIMVEGSLGLSAPNYLTRIAEIARQLNPNLTLWLSKISN